MFIKDILSEKKQTVSFEIFPPKKDQNLDSIYKTIAELSKLKPDFISVTYGAGGSSKDRTVEISSKIKNEFGIEALAHLTCVSSTKDEIKEILSELKNHNVNNVLALRGDIPKDFAGKEDLNYKYAKDLIRDIWDIGEFSIAAAAYPEGHIECTDIDEDIKHLKEKVSEGVDFLITQLFFDNNIFNKFADKIHKNNINIPVIAGIMPITSVKQIERIVSLSGAVIPEMLKEIISKYEHDQQAFKEYAIGYAIEQINNLINNGVKGVHIYTMNKPEVALKIMENIDSYRK
ncbi:methylenetetrahydrofolate reductase [NAD(P)H] [Clostridium sp. DJ247]|uniref:methylenetetrahydrofolate reductase [NAD(P)H] n=1 Tax=Clostridium sp. DJ247 TaxID=2726188 RepID=UPI0016234C1D|nr:methylenetetrahydrofolate reductase [NAD(P)H] [Clostridium sp. DJ247]MBC2579538.1 methylenetetrahydrofolate reductase [NAD(P)H] [Clostridium sp. DJ247]